MFFGIRSFIRCRVCFQAQTGVNVQNINLNGISNVFRSRAMSRTGQLRWFMKYKRNGRPKRRNRIECKMKTESNEKNGNERRALFRKEEKSFQEIKFNKQLDKDMKDKKL